MRRCSTICFPPFEILRPIPPLAWVPAAIMQRRAELARALINDPEIMILDEPFRGLDHMTRGLMQEYYSSLFEENPRTTLFITTDIDEAIFLADRLLIMGCILTNVHETIEVDLPRPRDREALLIDPQANEIKERALELLHVEAMKAFAGGSKAAADSRRRLHEAPRQRIAARQV